MNETYRRLIAAQLVGEPDDGLLMGGPSPRGWSHQNKIGTCPQRWAFDHMFGDPELRAVQVPEPPLAKGTLVHVALEHYWCQRLVEDHGGSTAGDLLDPVQAVAAYADRADADLARAGLPRSWYQYVDLCQNTARLYVQTHPHRVLRPVAVEHVVCTWHQDGAVVSAPPDADVRVRLAERGDHVELLRMGPPWLSSFRVDLLAARQDGRIAVYDWKSCYRNDVRKRRGFGLSGQMIQYQWWGIRAYGAEFGGVFAGLADFSQVAKGVADRAFPIVEVPWAPAAVRRFPRAVCDRAERLYALLASGRDPEDYPRAWTEQGPCEDRYGPCPHRRWCAEGVSPDVPRVDKRF